jgi:hypothetical protein
MYGSTTDSINTALIADCITLRDPLVRLKLNGDVRPYRLIAFDREMAKSTALVPLLIEMSYALDELEHPLISSDGFQQEIIGSSAGFEVGLIQWLLALHHYARLLPSSDIIDVENGQPARWNETQHLATLVGDTVGASAQFANWLLNERAIQDVVDASQCPVQLVGRDQPPILYGIKLERTLSPDQYDVMLELIAVFPKGLSEKQLREREGTKNINEPRFTLMDLKGARTGKKTPWTDVILNPANTGLGWRLKSK